MSNVYHLHPCIPITGEPVFMPVDLAAFGMPGRFEYLSVLPSPVGNYVVACLPFFTYGIAYGDLVAVKGPEFEFDRILASSKLRTFRLAIADAAQMDVLHETLHRSIIESGLPHEWHNAGYVSVLIRHQEDQDHLLSCIGDVIQSEDTYWEVDPEWP